jgi:DNA-directed RNA polymerase subunit RPC12/RpoP
MEPIYICGICGNEFKGDGYDPQPIQTEANAKCCEYCYINIVMHANKKLKKNWKF